jgi:serine/threonine-protein kinase
MKTAYQSRFYDLFLEAAALDADQREAFVREKCGGDVALRSALIALLENDRADSFLEPLDVRDKEDSAEGETDPLNGRHIGRYEIVRRLGSGGMGNVYLAFRTEDYSTQVAIKLIRRGMDSESIVQRFHDEMQFQAALGKHPNIAQVLDAGETDDGLPYYVMEHVDGQRIDRWCDRQRLSLKRRLALFREVCGAVQFAHQNTVIHRDLKPSNILVTAEGRPMLIDFGIAKVLGDAPGLPAADRTRTGMQVLTPEYASPEQVRGERLTTASDVYSLGVILYELLTGCRPYPAARRMPLEMLRVVADSTPQRPSDVVLKDQTNRDGHGDAATTTPDDAARARDMAPARLSRTLRGDLDRIVLMALRKEPDRRYGTAEQLAADVDRYLLGLPVHAQRDTWAYRARKFVRRNWAVLAAAAVVITSLIGGGAFSLTQWRRAEGEADRARQAAAEEGLAKQQAQRAQIAAEAEAAKAKATVDFLLNDLIYAAQPGQLGYQVTVLEAVEKSLDKIAARFAGQPETEAAVRNVAGNLLGNLGRLESTVEQYTLSYEILLAHLGPDHPDTIDSQWGLGVSYGRIDRRDRSIDMLRDALARSQRVLGEGAELSVGIMVGLGEELQATGAYDEANVLLQRAIELQERVYPPHDRRRYYALGSLAASYEAQGKLAEAEAIARQGVVFAKAHVRRDDVVYTSSHNRLTNILYQQHRYEEALPIAQDLVDHIDETMPKDDWRRGALFGLYGRCLWRLGRLEEAEPAMIAHYEILRDTRGPDDWMTERALGGVRDFMYDRGKIDEALAYQKLCLQTRLRIGGRDQGESVLASIAEYTEAAKKNDRFPGDDALYDELIQYGTNGLPKEHPHRAQFLGNLGWALLKKGELARAEPLLLASYEERKETQRMSHGDVHWLLDSLIDLYAQTDRSEKASELRDVLAVATSQSN